VINRITTARLRLRLITDSDADIDRIVELNSDPEVMRYLARCPPARGDVEQRVRESLDYRWVVFTRDTDEFVGWVFLHPDDDPARRGDYELGYRFRRAAWGHGYATEASRALMRRGFEELGARRVYALTMAVNVRSRAVMERCGLTYVRTFHEEWDDPLPGSEHGEVEYAITAEEWQAHG